MRTALEMPMDKSTVAVWSENIIKDLVCLAIQFGLMTIQPSNISAEVACCNSLITEQTIDKIKHIISKDGKCSIRNLRSVVEAIKVIKDMQIPWRELPESYGSWKTIYNIYRKWHNAGLLQSILSVINVD